MTKALNDAKGWQISFNPCFGGSYIVTASAVFPQAIMFSFNPCFGGSYIVTLL